MASQHLVSTFEARLDSTAAALGRSLRPSARLVHLCVMEAELTPRTTAGRRHDSPEPVVTLSELAASLCVSVQTIYDLRSQGRGPRGFRVGRELRFRTSEIEAWLARMEDVDADRHPAGGS